MYDYPNKASSPTQYYWYRSTLMCSPSVDEPEQINYHMAIALIVSWFLILKGNINLTVGQ
uniref:Uncharacterized protein n=1 Tax=Megaselia scalaris TaxID=36166 RepID=T1GVX1_MEGSC